MLKRKMFVKLTTGKDGSIRHQTLQVNLILFKIYVTIVPSTVNAYKGYIGLSFIGIPLVDIKFNTAVNNSQLIQYVYLLGREVELYDGTEIPTDVKNSL